jgi:hypothetical protein
MLFSGIAASAPAAFASGAGALVVGVGGARLKKISELITTATAHTTKAIASTTLGNGEQ